MVMEGRSGNFVRADARYKFTGKERDVESGYDYFGARYYDARVGRFIQADPMAHKLAGLTPYNYGANNSLKFIDPDGRFPYTFQLRSFGPPGSFSPTGYRDDNRGFSSRTDVTSRMSQQFTVDPSAGTFASWRARSDATYRSGQYVGTSNPRSSASASFDQNSLGSKVVAVSSSVAASNPEFHGWAPDIDVSSNIAVTENLKAMTVGVSIDLSSKQFPATEALMADISGQTIFLGGGAAFGNIFSLIGADQQQISSLDFVIGIGGNGVFQSVTFGGKTYSVAEWNKLATSRPAGPFLREDKDKK